MMRRMLESASAARGHVGTGAVVLLLVIAVGCFGSHGRGGGEGSGTGGGGTGGGPDGGTGGGPGTPDPSLCGDGLRACDGCGGELICTLEGAPCPDLDCPDPGPGPGPGPSCWQGPCDAGMCGCDGCLGDVLCVAEGAPCPDLSCPEPPPPPPGCDLPVCGPGMCGCPGCDGAIFCLPEGEPCPAIDCSILWTDCGDAMVLGQTGERCEGNWGCASRTHDCCYDRGRCDAGVLHKSSACVDDPECRSTPCEAFPLPGPGDCGDAIAGYSIQFHDCEPVFGCPCVELCDRLFPTLGECRLANRECLPHRACGHVLGDTCTRAELCDFPGDGCDFEDTLGTCTLRPSSCTGEWDPVCGCDGVTYVNECVAHLNRVDVAWPGTCGSPPRR